MACRYYDDILVAKISKWIPDKRKLRVLKPDETKRLFETQADDEKDKKLKLPLIALSRNNDIELELNIKNLKSFDGYTISSSAADLSRLKGDAYKEAILHIPDKVLKINTIPIKLTYQMDIYTKTYEEGDEYVRNFLFKLINNPSMRVEFPYNDTYLGFVSNIRVLNTISDTSAISERLFSGQFTRWTLNLEIQDAQLFSMPYKDTWRLYTDAYDGDSYLEVVKSIATFDEAVGDWGEKLDIKFSKSE